MTNNELLLAISDMMDTKLKAELQPLRNELQDFKVEIRGEIQDFRAEMRSEMQDFKTEMRNEMQDFKTEMRNEMQDFKTEIRNEMRDFKGEMWGEMQNFEGKMQNFEGKMQNFEDKMQNEMQEFKTEVYSEIHQIRLFQENIILPRLDTIESCYLDTYRRYRDNADRMEAVYEDVDLMKKVLADHSRQLQKLA